MSVTFDNPRVLFLLLLVPAFYLVALFGRAYLSAPVRTAVIATRLLLVTSLVLALAQPVLHRGSDLLSVIFLVDRTASVDINGTNAADSWLRQALGTVGARDRVGIVDFGANAVVRLPLGTSQPTATTATVDASETNLASALHLATSLFPPEGAHRIVVLSDGRTTVGNDVVEVRLDSTRRVRVDVVPTGPPAGFREVLVDSLTAPAAARVGQGFDLSVVVQSATAGDATLRVAMDDQTLSQATIQLQVGENRFSVNVPPAPKGFHAFEAAVATPNDTYPQNNRAEAFTVVEDAGRVAVIASDPNESAALVAALRSAQIKATTLAPTAIPPDLSAMKSFDGVILIDTPATALSFDAMKTLSGFVHHLGRGMIVIGGPGSYGPGKYDGTPLGDMLPVSSGVPGNVESGTNALVLVIDKSGSMDVDMGGVRKMVAANRAAQLAVGMLAPNDDVGVVAFDTDGTWVVPVETVGDPAHQRQIQGVIGQITGSGGTDIYAALKMAYDQVHLSSARYKHIILMSDGVSLTASNYDRLLQHIVDENITLSTIAIGGDADKTLMQMLATKGGGSYHYTDDANQIPQITTRDTQVVRGSPRVNAPFQPQVAAVSPLLASFAGRELPSLAGYTVTTARSNATVALQSERKDPILAHWNYGLGRVAVWTSDLTTAWGQSWLTWSSFNRFWSQVVNWSLRPPGDPNLQTSSATRGSIVDFRVDAVNDLGAFEDLVDLRARVAGANGQLIDVPLVQTRSGHYEARLAFPGAGAYPIDVNQYGASRQIAHTTTTGVVVSYPAEYHGFGVDQEKLAAVAAAGGGRELQSPPESFDRTGLDFAGQADVALWRLLLLLAAVFLPLDVAIRRLRVDPLDFARRGCSIAAEAAVVLRCLVAPHAQALARRLLRHPRSVNS